MKAYKSTDSYLFFFKSGWVNNAVVWDVKNRNIFIIKAKVHLLMFAAIHKVTSVPLYDEVFI